MGLFYRKRKGGVTVSASRRGPRMSIGFGGGGKSGCAIPAALMVVVGLALILVLLRAA